MENNIPTTVLTSFQKAEAFAISNYGSPRQWTPVTGITEERLSLNIQDAYLAGYNSRDEEVAELVNHIQKMWHSNAWNGESYEGIRSSTTTLLNKYQNKQP